MPEGPPGGIELPDGGNDAGSQGGGNGAGTGRMGNRRITGTPDGIMPKTLEGLPIGMSDAVRGQVVLAFMQTGKDPLEGTGLHYSEDLKYDGPSAPAEPSVPGPGEPAPTTMPGSSGAGGDPYAGMGKF